MLRSRRKPKQITFSRLVEVFNEINARSLIHSTETSTRWKFERSLEYLREQGLQPYIDFATASVRDNVLPLISEHHLYDISNVIVRDLEIEMDNPVNFRSLDASGPISFAKWHFEGCRFWHTSNNMCSMVFPWRGSFRFYRNEFALRPTLNESYWFIGFVEGSRVWFDGNDFGEGKLLTECSGIHKGTGTDEKTTAKIESMREGSISLVAIKRLEALSIQRGFSTIVIAGMNRIGHLNVDLNVNEENHLGKSIYLGPREKIDASFNNCLHHRNLYLSMRRIAAFNQDTRQLSILDTQLDRIEYFLNRERSVFPIFNLRMLVEYWQDRVLYAWSCWSSDFYKSWLLPVVFLITGYLLLNALPLAVIDEYFDLSHGLNSHFDP